MRGESDEIAWSQRHRPTIWLVRSSLPVGLAAFAGLWLLVFGAIFVETYEQDARLGGPPRSYVERLQDTRARSAEVVVGPVRRLGRLLGAGAGPSRREQAAAHGVPFVQILIAPQHEAQLQARADAALRREILLQGDDAFVPAWLRIEGQSAPLRAKVRLKGDWVDHLREGRWSLRVRMRDGAQFLGMRAFSLHAPQTRGGHGELLLLDQMRAHGVLAPRSRPVVAQLNERDFGLMLIEEHFDRAMIEAAGRRPGVLIGFDEDGMWRQKVRYREWAAAGSPQVPEAQQVTLSDVGTMPVRVFRASAVRKDPQRFAEAASAVSLLRGYLRGAIAAEDVFDLRLWARHQVLVSVFGAMHGLAAHNVRLYFNPITRLLEPVAFDNNTSPDHLDADGPPEWHDVSLVRGAESEVFRDECSAFLRTLCGGEGEGEGAFEDVLESDTQLAKLMDAFGELPSAYHLTKLRTRARALTAIPLPRPSVPRGTLDLADDGDPWTGPPPSRLLNAYWVAGDGGAQLECTAVTTADTVIESVVWRHGRRHERVRFDTSTWVAPGGAEARTRIAIPVPWSPADPGDLTVVCRRVRRDLAPDRREPHVTQLAMRGALARTRPLLETTPVPDCVVVSGEADGDGAAWRVRPGDWEVPSSWILPPGFGLQVGPATTLRFGEHARIIVRGGGHLRLEGTATAPIELLPGAEENFSGLVVLGDHISDVAIRHTTIRSTAMDQDSDWALTGGVTLHRCASVVIEDSVLDTSASEDALNVVECPDVAITRTRFSGVRSDAVDGDVVAMTIEDCTFVQVGGDAVDVSFSELHLRRLDVRGVVDKAVSIGEGSRCWADDLTLSDVGTGVVAKDGSTVVARRVAVRQARVAGLMVYIKKPSFGAARMEVTDLAFADPVSSAVPCRVQAGSQLWLDGEPVRARTLDVGELYRTSMRKERGPR